MKKDKLTVKGEEEPDLTTVDVEGLLSQLSSKNDDYVFKLRRILSDNGMDDAKQHDILARLLPEMLENQHAGKPATQVYGPVTEKANSILFAPKPKKKAPFLLGALDLSLFFGAVFAGIFGLMTAYNPKQAQAANGFLPLVVMAVSAGFIFTYFNDWAAQDKATRKKTWIVMMWGMLAVFGASLISSAVSVLNTPLTRPMPWQVALGVAVVFYGIHFYLKKKYNLKGVLQS